MSKLCHYTVIKRILEKYFKLYRSEDAVMQKLTNRSIRRAIRQLEKGADTETVAKEAGVTRRHIQRLWVEYRDEGYIHVQSKPGRPPKPVSPRDVKAVLKAYASNPAGVKQITKSLGNRTSHRRVYQIMKSNGLITPSRAKAKKRK